MSIKWLIIYNAIAGGAGALVGYALSEFTQGADGRWFSVALTCGLVGGTIGAGMNLVAGMNQANAKWPAQRLLPGLIAGGLAGAIGGSFGNLFFRTLGWMLMGAGLGAVEGLYERSPKRLRSGLIGGSVGGLIGGFLFNPVYSLLSILSGAVGRAAAFVVLGACIGAMIGVAKVIFAEAWLTVLDGDRPGRRFVLVAPSVWLGRANHAALPFMGKGEVGVDKEHARIVRLSDGRFTLEDNHSRHGTSVNLTRVLDPVVLKEGDVIRIGANSIQFRERPGRRPKLDVTPVTPPAPAPARPTPAPAATTSTRPEVTAPSKPARPLPRGMSLCPKCQRPVPGTRPYCVVCKLSF
jgi:FHA domain